MASSAVAEAMADRPVPLSRFTSHIGCGSVFHVGLVHPDWPI